MDTAKIIRYRAVLAPVTSQFEKICRDIRGFRVPGSACLWSDYALEIPQKWAETSKWVNYITGEEV